MKMRDIAPFGLRLPEALSTRIDSAMASSGRSKNAEIVYRLVESFVLEDRPLSTYSDGDLIRELVERHEKGKIRIEIEK
ncbi:MAG: Arc-like binding domain [Burkholderiaceae bacterium]|nr:Arc-like binding domain [Burkholderiaceae bacterium]